MAWTEVEYILPTAHSIAWDGCHKIYVLLDTWQTETMTEFGYRENVEGGSHLYLTTEVGDYDAVLERLRDWYGESCPLKFINAVETHADHPNGKFTQLITQGEYDEEIEDEDQEP